MKTRTIFVLLVAAVLVAVPGVSALSQYVPPGQALYGSNFSCGTCHTNPAGAGPRTAYGELFAAQPNHTVEPGITAALIAIGSPYPNVTPSPTVTVTPNVTRTPTVTPNVTAVTPNVTRTPTVTPNVTVTGTPTVTVPPETRRVIEIIDNITGVPLINQSTSDILAEDFINFNAGDRYNITVTSVSGGVVEYNASGVLVGGPKQTIRVNWTPRTQGAYILRSDANTTTEARIVQVINQKVISPIPELSTIALVSAGLLGLFGLARKRKNN